jgi:uncharacterized membrane protein YqjE
MILKILAAVVAVVLMVIYLIPPVYKLQEIELGVVVAIGLAMMLVDLWQSLRSKED